MVGLRKKRGGIRIGPAPLKGSYERGNVPSYQKPPSPAGSQLRQTGSFKAHREGRQLACGKWGRERPA